MSPASLLVYDYHVHFCDVRTWLLGDARLVVFTPSCDLLPLSAGWTESLVSNDPSTANMMGCDAHASMINDCGFHVADLLLLLPSYLHGLMTQAARLEKPTWQGTEGTLRPSAHEKLRPTAHAELKPANNHTNKLDS